MMDNNVIPFHADPLRKAYELIDSIYEMAPTPEQAAKLDEAIRYLQLAIEQSQFRENADHDDF